MLSVIMNARIEAITATEFGLTQTGWSKLQLTPEADAISFNKKPLSRVSVYSLLKILREK